MTTTSASQSLTGLRDRRYPPGSRRVAADPAGEPQPRPALRFVVAVDVGAPTPTATTVRATGAPADLRSVLAHLPLHPGGPSAGRTAAQMRACAASARPLSTPPPAKTSRSPA